jgi:tRNA (guanine-N7-)-methyltransferase
MSEFPQPPRRKIEREFGVPVPGEILAEDRWTQTGLKRLPDGLIRFDELFGRVAPVMLDLGCGNGRSTLYSSVWRAGFDHLAVDVLPVVIRYATRRANQRGLSNVKFAVCGGLELLKQHIAPGSIHEIHVYHPQPYYTPEEIPKRLVTPEFVALVHRALVPGGVLVLQTDHPAYFDYMSKLVPHFFEFKPHPGRWPDAPKGKTRREIIALKKGLSIFRATATPKLGLSIGDVQRLAETLPVPTFDADRRLLELDRLEREG